MKINNLFIIFLSFLLVAILISVSFFYISNFNDSSYISEKSLLEIQQKELTDLPVTSSGIIYINNSSTVLIETLGVWGKL